MSTLAPIQSTSTIESTSNIEEYLSIFVGGQTFGIPVLKVQDVLSYQRVASIPLSPPQIRGSINLRGRIVTVIDMRILLELDPFTDEQKPMNIVVEHGSEAYSLLVDEVGEVIELNVNDCEPNPATIDPKWRELSNGLFRLDKELMMVLDIALIANWSEEA